MKSKDKTEDRARNFLKQDLFLNTLPFHLLCLDEKLNISFCNDAYAQFVGKSSSKIVGKRILDVFSDFKKTNAYEIYREVLRTGIPQEVELRLRDRFLHSWIYKMNWGILVVAYDVTERKIVQNELQQRESLDATLFECSPIQTIVVDLDGRVVKFNKAKKESGDRLPKIGDVMYKDYAAKHENDMYRELIECIKSQKGKGFPELRYGDRILSISVSPFPNGAVIAMDDITERINAEKALKESEETYRTLVQTSPDAVATTDLDGNITYVSRRTLEFHGYKDEKDLLGKSTFELIAPEERDKAMANMQKTLKDGQVSNIEFILLKKDGSRFPVEMNASLIKDANGVPYGFICSFRDIAERKKFEEERSKSEAKYRGLVEEAGIAILIDDQDGNFVYCNRKYAEIFGYSEEDIKNHSLETVVHPDDKDRVLGYHKKRVGGKEVPSHYEVKGLKKDGSSVYLEVHVEPLKEGNKIVGTRSYVWDITERKKAEDNLRESEEKYSNLFHHSNDAIFIHDLEGNIIDVNNQVLELFGYKKEEILSMKIAEIHPPEVLEKSKWVFNTISKDGYVQFEIDFKRKNGGIFTAEVSSSLFEIGGKKFVQGFVRDITKRKIGEEALKESEEMYRTLVETAPEAVTMSDLEGNITFVSQKTLELHGYKSSKELIGRSGLELVAPEDRQKAMKNIQRTMKEGSLKNIEYELLRKDRDSFIGEVNASLIKDAQGNSKAFIITTRDISERKQTEEALQIEKAYLEQLFDNALEAIVMSENDGRVIRVNEEFLRLFGYSLDEVIGKPIDALVTHGEQLDEALSITKEAAEGRKNAVETIRRRKDGTTIHVSIFASPIIVGDKQVAVYGIYRDITERKKAESALRESEEKYRSLIEQTLQGIVVVQDFKIVYTNKSFANITGYSIEELKSFSPQDVEDLVHPDDKDLVWGRMKERLQGKSVPDRYEFRGMNKKGEIRWLEMLAQLIQYEGKPAVQATMIDITDRKEAVQAVTRLASLPEQNPNPIIETDLEGNVTYVNPVAEQKFKKLEKEGIKHPILNDLDSIIEGFKKGGEVAVSRELEMDGEVYEQIICYAPESNLIRIFNFDVTDRKRFEKELQDSLDRLENTIDNTLEAMAKILETRDPYTAGHQTRVAALALAIAEAMNLSEDQKRGLHVAAVIHDIGKIYVPAEILTRPTALTDSEFALIKTHPKIGYDILKTIDFPWPVAEIVLQHHERWDGSGYPHGLKGKDTLLEARILAVADVVEAMSSHRPYRPAKGLEATLEEISNNRGVYYDPEIVDVCLKVIKDKGFKF